MLQFYLQLLETEEDRELFADLYKNYRERMWYVANQQINNGELAEDAVHNAFLALMDHMDALHGRSPQDQMNYLLKAAKNAAINLSMRESTQEKYYVNFYDELITDAILEELCAKLDKEVVVSTIGQLKEPYNTVLYLHFVMEMKPEEIASALKRKSAAVRQQLSRGRRLLHEMLKEALSVHV